MSADQDPAVRLINLVVALRNSRAGLTKQQIYRQIDGYGPGTAGERMFERDKTIIREMGISLRTIAVFGQDERYRIDPDDYGMEPITFNREEGAVLALAAKAWHSGGLGEVAARALDKLRALGIDCQDEPFEFAIGGADAVASQLLDAINAAQQVSFSYRTARTGQLAQRHVQPWRLRSTPAGLYLLGHDLDKQAARVFKLTRINGPVTVFGPSNAFQKPADSQVQAALGEVFPVQAASVSAKLAASPAAARLLALKGAYGAPEGETTSSTNGPLQLLWPIAHLDAAAQELASLGSQVQVLQPAELVKATDLKWQAAAQLHERPPSEPARLETPQRAQSSRRVRAPASTGQRAGRLLALLAYLNGRGPVPLTELAQHFDSSPTKIKQELNTLWLDIGLPGLGGGDLVDLDWDDNFSQVALRDGLELQTPLKLTTNEAAILIATLRGWLSAGDLPGGVAAGTALAKLTAAFEAAGQALEVSLPHAPQIPAALKTARVGIGESRAIQFDYVDAAGQPSQRQVDPMRLFNDQNHWLLAAWDHQAKAERYFRLDRMSKTKLLAQPAEPHRATTKTWNFAKGGNWQVSAVFAATVRHRAEELQRCDDWELEGGALLVTLAVARSSWIVSLALALGGELEILAPAELRAQVVQEAKAALAG
ncbi:MAG: WYL domain-containing protein [Micrococcales bacterium]|nr:WYL domain-containing protein [Micrococcales bacterium]